MVKVVKEENPTVKTHVLVISDTHGKIVRPEDMPLRYADVAIHCGDLTNGSQLCEFRNAIELLQAIKSPLKLVIAGNHDFTLDSEAFERIVAEAIPPLDLELVAKEYGKLGEARRILDEASGIVFLDEGTHKFKLNNGARLTVYASPWTPAMGAWGFQYHPNKGHEFLIGEDVDIAITHGPPRGILDYTAGRERAGCPDLFAAVARARPRLHCFGHIHEAWGAKLVVWKNIQLDKPTHFTMIDNTRSVVVDNLAGLRRSPFDSDEDWEEKRRKKEMYAGQRCCLAEICKEDDLTFAKNDQTLFINAAYVGDEDMPTQWPWLVEVELPKAT